MNPPGDSTSGGSSTTQPTSSSTPTPTTAGTGSSTTNTGGSGDPIKVDETTTAAATSNAGATTATAMDVSERSASNAPPPTGAGETTNTTSPAEPTDQAVLEYLKKRGMGSAILELNAILKKSQDSSDAATGTATNDKPSDQQQPPPAQADQTTPKPQQDQPQPSTSSSSSTTTAKTTTATPSQSQPTGSAEASAAGTSPSSATPMAALKQQLEQDEAIARNQRSVLTKSTGGGFGYDRDAAVPIVQWGVPENPRSPSSLGEAGKLRPSLGAEEGRAYLDAFCALQLWILSLPDDPSVGSHIQPRTTDPIRRAQALLKSDATISLSSFVKQIANPTVEPTTTSATSTETAAAATTTETSTSTSNPDATTSSSTPTPEPTTTSTTTTATPTTGGRRELFHLPPSAKPELLAVSFALLVHTYCELLEVGMESTAHVLRDAFQPVYDPLYGNEFRDLFQCTTTDDIIRLNTHNSQHMEALASLKSNLVQVASFQLKKEELAQTQITDSATQSAAKQKIHEYDQTIAIMQQKYNDLSKRASVAFDRIHDLPFLRRARAVRWQLSLSTTSFGMLASFLSTGTTKHSSLLAMSTLLQTKCELHVEQRDPLPFTPACVLDDEGFTPKDKKPRKRKSISELNESIMVNWASPAPRKGESNDPLDAKDLPFPKFHLDDDYEDDNAAALDKRLVEFNRAVLVNGFRRLEALERKREYQVMAKPTIGEEGISESSVRAMANPLEPSILLSTLCANSNSVARKRYASSTNGNIGAGVAGKGGDGTTIAPAPIADASSIWEEAGIGLCCAKVCPPDGRRVAVGCDDSCVRIWNLMDGMGPDGSMGEPAQVLIGHKNGFPVFDLDWNRDGRTLLTAGGDGSVRLWDTMAQGPFGQVSKQSGGKDSVSASGMTSTSLTGGASQSASTSTSSGASFKKSSSSGGVAGSGLGGNAASSAATMSNTAAKEMLAKATAELERAKVAPDMNVPGLRPESTPYQSGAALAVYRGHAPSTPIWSVAFAPCGYYFASAGADATARLWTTDRTSPVRLLVGHTSNSVNAVEFHPNCNYVLTGGEDRTARLWDIQTGRTVRILNGCKAGVNVVKVSPCGRYAAGADYSGIVHLWDIGTGRKVTQFLPKTTGGSHHHYPPQGVGATKTPPMANIHHLSIVNCLSFSACGKALAAGGDDCCVRIWDVRKVTREEHETKPPVVDVPSKIFPTRRTVIMDLHFTKRNLLLSVGKFATPVPVSVIN